MTRDDRGNWLYFTGLLMAFLLPLPAAATPPATPITLEIEIDRAPKPFESSSVTIRVSSVVDAPSTEVELVLPDGIVAEQTSWLVDLEANSPVVLSTTWVITGAVGNVSISARAVSRRGPGETWGDMDSIPLHVGAAQSRRGWRANLVPVAELVEPGDAAPLSRRPTAFPGPPAPLPSNVPAVAPSLDSTAHTSLVQATGTVTLTGRWRYHDRDGITRDIDQQVLEIRRGDGGPLDPRVYCYTSTDGTFSCSFSHPGTTLRVWVRSWTNYSTGPTRLGVFEGPEVSGGCGSDSVVCSYPVQTGTISCASGSTCAVGTWVVATSVGEPWLGAHQMEQDLIRSWKKLRFDSVHPSGSINPGPTRINYPVSSGHGTHAHVNGWDSWISIEPPNQMSADIVVHEYGHAVMSNLWAGYSPRWPTRDCPSPHYISQVSGPGCALSEGFANFWAWYGNQFYDGDGSFSNDGPVFNWPGGASTNLETRGGGSYASGDRVEGNVAAAMGDFFDSANEGPSSGPGDRLSQGVQHVWHTTYTQSDDNFAQWWSAYRAHSSHEPCESRDVLHHNTINYSTPTSCDGGTTTCSAFADCSNAGGGSVSCTGTSGDCFGIDSCYAYCDGQYYFCPDPGGGMICPL